MIVNFKAVVRAWNMEKQLNDSKVLVTPRSHGSAAADTTLWFFQLWEVFLGWKPKTCNTLTSFALLQNCGSRISQAPWSCDSLVSYICTGESNGNLNNSAKFLPFLNLSRAHFVGHGEAAWWKNSTSKIAWDCPFNNWPAWKLYWHSRAEGGRCRSMYVYITTNPASPSVCVSTPFTYPLLVYVHTYSLSLLSWQQQTGPGTITITNPPSLPFCTFSIQLLSASLLADQRWVLTGCGNICISSSSGKSYKGSCNKIGSQLFRGLYSM